MRTPYEIKGKVTLVTGIKPNTTATLINTWINNRDVYKEYTLCSVLFTVINFYITSILLLTILELFHIIIVSMDEK